MTERSRPQIRITDRDSNTHSSSNAAGASAARIPIADYNSYDEAENAVDYLSGSKFPVELVAIVGEGVRVVEQVVGRLNHGGAALRGAGVGAVTGVLFGWLFSVFDWIQPLVTGLTLAAYGLVFGAVIGALLGLAMHALHGGRRDFSSLKAIVPSRYRLVADEEVADEARLLLAMRSDPGR
jgi:hypothetical protein